jgi:hypothetical protein
VTPYPGLVDSTLTTKLTNLNIGNQQHHVFYANLSLKGNARAGLRSFIWPPIKSLVENLQKRELSPKHLEQRPTHAHPHTPSCSKVILLSSANNSNNTNNNKNRRGVWGAGLLWPFPQNSVIVPCKGVEIQLGTHAPLPHTSFKPKK